MSQLPVPPQPPEITFTELQALYLTPNGWGVKEPQPLDFFNEHNRVYIEKDAESFPLHFQSKYKWLQMYHLLKNLDFEIPALYADYYAYQKSIKGTRLQVDIEKDTEDDNKNKGGN